MELRFVSPDLRKLDLLVSEVLAVPISLGERPPRGSAGLIDYRLAGRISSVIKSGALQGKIGDLLLLSGRPKLTFDKVLLYGQGDTKQFNPQVFAALVDQLLSSFSELGVRRAVVELPGRSADLISPELAAEILLARAGSNPIFDTWTLVDSMSAQRVIAHSLQRERRSEWRAPK